MLKLMRRHRHHRHIYITLRRNLVELREYLKLLANHPVSLHISDLFHAFTVAVHGSCLWGITVTAVYDGLKH